MLKLSPLQLSVWSQVTEWRADGSSSRKRWLIELQCDCPESVQPAWLTPSLPPSSSSILLLPAALFPPPSLTADAVSGALENKGWRTSAPHSCVCVCSFHPAELYCFVISSSLLLSARCRFCSVFPWDHSQSSRQSNCAVETCVFTSTCLSLRLRLLQLTSDPALFSFFFHSENSKRSRWRGSRDKYTKRQWAEYDGRAKLNFLSFLKVFSSLIHLQHWWISGTSFSVTSVGSLTPWESLRSYLGHRHLGRSWRSLKQVRV